MSFSRLSLNEFLCFSVQVSLGTTMNTSMAVQDHNASGGNFTFYSQADEDAARQLTVAKDMFYASYMWIFFLLGFPGNIACVATVLRMSTLSTATLYVALLAVVDAIALLLKLVFHQLIVNKVTLGEVGCSLVSFVNITSCYANWVLVLVCLERFLAVSFPLKKGIYFTKRRACVIAAVLFLFIFLIHTHLFFIFIPSGYTCQFAVTWGDAWKWISTLIYCFLPFFFLLVLTTLIVVGLRRYQAARKSLLGCQTQKHSKKDKRNDSWTLEHTISIMMVLAAVVFLVLTLPICVFIIYTGLYREGDNPLEKARRQFVEQLVYFMQDLTHVVNFYLYFLAADKFRSKFKDMISCRPTLDRKRSDTNNSVLHTQYTLANSTENIPMSEIALV